MSTDNKPAAPGLPQLPEPEMEDVPAERWGQNIVHKALYTAEQMRDYARAALSQPVPSAPEPSEYLWRVFNLGFPKGHEDGSGRWGDWNLISREDAQRLAADDEHKSYEFVPYLPVAPVPAAAPAGEPSTRERFLGCLRHVAALKHEPRLSIDEVMTAYDYTRGATLPASPEPAAAPAVEPRVTEEMITAYLTANDAYWKRIDGEPTKLGKWRNGTPSEATRISLEAALSTIPASPEPATQGAAIQIRQADERGDDALKRAHKLEEALEYLFLAIVTRADSDYLFRAVNRADEALRYSMPGWTPPVPMTGWASPAPEPLTPAAGVSDQQIMKIHHESFEPMQGRKNSYMLNPIKFARAVLALPVEKQGD